MKHSNNFKLMSVLVIVAGGTLAACSSESVGHPSPVQSGIAGNQFNEFESSCASLEFKYPVAEQIRDVLEQSAGRLQSDRQKDFAACDRYRTGGALTELRSVPVEWDTQCLSNEGWALNGDAVPFEVAPDPSVNRYYPADVAHCAAPLLTPDKCESLRQALEPGQSAMSYNTASVLSALKCGNSELREPAR